MVAGDHTGSGGGLPPAIELAGISKSFGPVQANRNIDLKVEPYWKVEAHEGNTAD